MLPYPPPYPYGYPHGYGYRYAGPDAELRVDVKPRTAAVYVDGYYAGLVDDFDGVFQRLHLAPGSHDIVVYLAGHRSLREQLYIGPNTTRTIRGRLEPLAPGEPNEPVPVPAGPPNAEGAGPEPRSAPRRLPPPGRGRGGVPPPPPAPGAERPATSGTLVLRVQPAGSDILIDGERWDAPDRPDGRLIVQLSEGHHVVEVRKSGYGEVRNEIDVRRGETVPLNISLSPQ
jgi:hypothetical protein